MTDTIDAMITNIALAEQRLANALTLIAEARTAASSRQQNLAVGCLLPAQQDIADASALLATVLILQRSRR